MTNPPTRIHVVIFLIFIVSFLFSLRYPEKPEKISKNGFGFNHDLA